MITAMNYFEFTLDPVTGNSIPGTSSLGVTINDQRGMGAWAFNRIQPADAAQTITGSPDITSTAWHQPVTSGVMPESTVAIVAEGMRVFNGDSNNKIIVVRSNNSGTTWESPLEISGAVGNSPSRPTVAIDETGLTNSPANPRIITNESHTSYHRAAHSLPGRWGEFLRSTNADGLRRSTSARCKPRRAGVGRERWCRRSCSGRQF